MNGIYEAKGLRLAMTQYGSSTKRRSEVETGSGLSFFWGQLFVELKQGVLKQEIRSKDKEGSIQ